MSDDAKKNDVVASQKTAEPQFKTEREVIDYFTTLSQEVNLARGKIGELAVSLREHVNVLQNIKDLDPSRRCFRSVGGVLVERTVKEVIPAVETNAANLQKAIDAIKEQCAVKEAELEALRRKYKIRVQGEEGDGGAAAGSAAKSSGVLA
jgi:prefoldin subunit 2